MSTLPSSVRVFLAVGPTSMHLSFDRLGGLAKRMGLDPTGGLLLVFINRPKLNMKLLFHDRSGYCQVYERLERGTFEVPTDAAGLPLRRELTPTELELILEGVALEPRARRLRNGCAGISP